MHLCPLRYIIIIQQFYGSYLPCPSAAYPLLINLDMNNLMPCHSCPTERKSQGKNHRKTKIPFPFTASDLQPSKTALHYHRRGWGHTSLYGRAGAKLYIHGLIPH